MRNLAALQARGKPAQLAYLSVYHEPTRVEPDHRLELARLMREENRAARALPQGSSLAYKGLRGKARAGLSLNLLTTSSTVELEGLEGGIQ